MADTTLALADVVEKLRAGGWFITGGADKVKSGSPVYEFIEVVSIVATDGGWWTTLGGNCKAVSALHVTEAIHPNGNEGVIYVYGNRPISQQHPRKAGGGTYTILRETRLLTLENPRLIEAHAAKQRRNAWRLHEELARKLTRMFHEVTLVQPIGGPTDQHPALQVTFRDGRTSIIKATRVPGASRIVVEFDFS